MLWANEGAVRDVLVIDDDEVSRELLLLFLAEAGYEGQSAASGDEGLELLQAREDKPFAVLADMQMQGTTGNALARELRRMCGAETKVIAMSGSTVAAAATESFDGFLLKPMTVSGLRVALEDGVAAEPVGDESVPGVLNEATYASLAQSMPAAQMMQLYRMCIDDAERRIQEMREAAAVGDAGSYERSAHAIKGGCGMVGAAELAALAAEMEQNGMKAGGKIEPLEQFLAASARLRRILDSRVV